MSWQEIHEALGAVRTLCEPPVSITVEIHESALRIAQRYRYNIYDALMIATALSERCDVLYSEDMPHGHKIDNLRIHNPFG